jgi:hypothetical protein
MGIVCGAEDVVLLCFVLIPHVWSSEIGGCYLLDIEMLLILYAFITYNLTYVLYDIKSA